MSMIFFTVTYEYIFSVCHVYFHIMIRKQADNTYARNIESLVSKVCSLCNDPREDHNCIRASSLQCLSALVILDSFQMNSHLCIS